MVMTIGRLSMDASREPTAENIVMPGPSSLIPGLYCALHHPR